MLNIIKKSSFLKRLYYLDWNIRKYFKYKLIENSDLIINDKIKNKFQPLIYHKNINDNFYDNNSIKFYKQFYYVINNAYLVGPEAIGVTSQNEIIVDTAGGSVNTLGQCSPKKFMYHKMLTVEKTIDYASVFITPYINGNNNNFFHWIIECLLLIEGVIAYENNTGIRPKIIINNKPQKYQIESLKLLGFNKEDIIFWTYEKVLVKNLVVPACRLGIGKEKNLVNPESMYWLRKTMMSNIAVSNDDRHNILISREGSKGRRFVNHSDIVKMLDEFNYKEYRLELLSEEEKIKLFSNARNIIGGHGAGLMNMMFCSNANVIAIICEDSTQVVNRSVRGIFKYLAISLEIDYYELFSEISYANYLNANLKSSLKEYDLNVDLDKLKYLMKKSNMI